MRKFLFLFPFFFTLPAFAWNVTQLGFYDPDNLAHYLDITFEGGSTAYVSGSGGFSIMNISNLSAPTRTGHLQRPNTEPLPNCAVLGNRALVCAVESGLHVVNISNPAAPSLVTTFAIGQFNFEDAKFFDAQTALICIGEQGVGLLSLVTPSSPSWITTATQGLTYAKACALSSDLSTVYIADDIGLVVYSRSGNTLSYLASLPLTGDAVDIQLSGNRAYVARGVYGVSIVDVTTPSSPGLLGEFAPNVLASKISVAGNLVAIANWEDFEVFDATDPNAVALAGSKWTPQRAMCVAMRSDTMLVGDWGIFRTYHYGTVTGPDLDIVPRYVQFSVTQVGSSRTEILQFINTGQQPVDFGTIQILNPNYTLDYNGADLAPDDTVASTLTYTPTDSTSGTSQIRVNSNDPDETLITISLTGNPPPGGVSIGNPAPDFTLPVHGGGTWQLADYRGRIVVMCFFASW